MNPNSIYEQKKMKNQETKEGKKCCDKGAIYDPQCKACVEANQAPNKNIEGWEDTIDKFKDTTIVFSTSTWDGIKDIIRNLLQAQRSNLVKEIDRINLAPDDKTISDLTQLDGENEGFGYGQIWMLKKIRNLINSSK
jgi:hypothetical protein